MMKTWLVDYEKESGLKTFASVEAETKEDAVRIFRSKGLSWLGTDFGTVKILAVTERMA